MGFILGVFQIHGGISVVVSVILEICLPNPVWPGYEDINLSFKTADLRNHFHPTPQRAIKKREVLENRDLEGVSRGVGRRG